MTSENRDKIFFHCDPLENSFSESLGQVEGDFHEKYLELEILGEVN